MFSVRGATTNSPRRRRAPIIWGALVSLAVMAHAAAPVVALSADPGDSAAGVEFFEQKIRPILATHCGECHGGAKSEGGLRLDSRSGWVRGGDSGPAVVPGDPDNSLLVLAVRQSGDDLKMPPRGKLSEVQIADLEAWVQRGAADPRTGPAAEPGKSNGMSLEEGRRFWSFQPVRAPAIPQVHDVSWPLGPVDHFVLARMEAAGVRPAPTANRRTLLRRAAFDLTGLPPTPAEMEAFLADTSPQSFEAAIDRLLASPRYGQRWGRHWLDVVRYADTCGNASDYPVPQAAKYRDWVIRAFNRNLPYDEFLRQQIAGDLLAGTPAEHWERLTATGYLAIARRFGGSRLGEHHLTLEDTIDNLGRAMLGSSIACARCHDHKFDPFTMSDYYGLYGIFESTRYPFPGAESDKRQADFVPLMTPEQIEALRAPHREQLAKVDAEIKSLEAAEAEARKLPDGPDKARAVAAAAEALAEARKNLATVAAQAPMVDDAYAVAEGTPVNTRMHVRGDPQRLGDEVPRHFPAVLGGQELPRDAASSGRLELARWITDPQNPLTARVMANRIWQFHFGRGVVATPNDFGARGAAPTHPELLDYLAARFVESGWSVKEMHRLILLSRTWQLSSGDAADWETREADSPRSGAAALAANVARDPSNNLFWKFERFRLDAESIRDTLLYVAGDLDESLGGAHPFPPPDTWRWTQHNPFVAVYETRRRSVYLMQQRLKQHPFLALFGGADPNSSTGARLPGTTPLQALFVMNDPLVHAASERFAERLRAMAGGEAAQIAAAHQIVWSRPATPVELRQSEEFLQRYRRRLSELQTPPDQSERLAWSALARGLIGSNEFVYVD